MVNINSLKDLNCLEEFTTSNEMQEYLDSMNDADAWVNIEINSIITKYDDANNCAVLKHNGGEVEIWPFDMDSLEERSGDNAIGHRLMTTKQIMNSMNNYWPLQVTAKKVPIVGKALIRGEKLLTLRSDRYAVLPQNKLFEVLSNYINHKFDEAKFDKGKYMHSITSALWTLPNEITKEYKTTWIKSGLPKNLLEKSVPCILFETNDIGTRCATVYIYINVNGRNFLLGNPLSIKHKGSATTKSFEKLIDQTHVTIVEGLTCMADLMKVKLDEPKSACIRAMKAVELDKITKKGCKELLELSMFNPKDSAYMVYMFLYDIFDTESGQKLSPERKMRVEVALRRLLVTDWSKLDRKCSDSI